MGWGIVESEGGEFAYHIVLTGADGVGKVQYGAKNFVAAKALMDAMQTHELVNGGMFVVPETPKKAKRTRAADKR